MTVTEYFRMINIIGSEGHFLVTNSVDTGTNKYKWCINLFRQNTADWSSNRSNSSGFSDILATNVLASEGLSNLMVLLASLTIKQYAIKENGMQCSQN